MCHPESELVGVRIGSKTRRERSQNAIRECNTDCSGATERYRRLATELDPHLGEYETLNDRYEVGRHVFWISHARDNSDIGVSVYDISPEGLRRMGKRRWDPRSSYDAWWLEFVHEVNGVDLTREPPHREPPEQVFAWTGT